MLIVFLNSTAVGEAQPGHNIARCSNLPPNPFPRPLQPKPYETCLRLRRRPTTTATFLTFLRLFWRIIAVSIGFGCCNYCPAISAFVLWAATNVLHPQQQRPQNHAFSLQYQSSSHSQAGIFRRIIISRSGAIMASAADAFDPSVHLQRHSPSSNANDDNQDNERLQHELNKKEKVDSELERLREEPIIPTTPSSLSFSTTTIESLCQKRNVPFQQVKNVRDLASVRNSPIQPGRVFRMGRLSDATDADIVRLSALGFQTLVDLRSPTELKEDASLLRPEVFDPFTSMVWKEQGRDGCLKELKKGENPVKTRKFFWKKKKIKEYLSDDVTNTQTNHADDVTTTQVVSIIDDIDCDDCLPLQLVVVANRRERHFVSIMNEFKYIKGTMTKLRKRDITKAVLKTPGAFISKRVRNSLKQPFLDEINGGGLPMLNELLLRYGAPGIKYVLELIADRNRHPISWYCTAGKDRTGMIAALVLSLCGVSDEDIVEDYALSANVYAEMNDHKAMVGALSQRNLDPHTFLGAPPEVMHDTLAAIRNTYGSVSSYCTWIGFGIEKQEALRRACVED